MVSFFNKVISDPDNYSIVLDAIDYFEEELIEARNEVNMDGNIERVSAALPGIVEYRYSQLQEIEAILEHLNLQLTKIKGKRFRHYFESYNRELSAREAEKFAEADEEVLTIAQIINQFALIRNRFISVHKGFEVKGFQINNIIKLRTAGMEDAEMRAIYTKR